MTTDQRSIRQLLVAATALLEGSSDSPRLDAEVLLADCVGEDRSWLYAHHEAIPSTARRERFDMFIARRRAGTPVAHLLGWREFWSLPISVTPATLIPRPETELLVDWALACLHEQRHPRVLELGTGSGAIALALATERPDAQLTATESSAAALDVARRNAVALDLDRIDWHLGDWFAAVPDGGRFDLIVTNPPYVTADDPHLDAGDLRFEPHAALIAGPDGLRDIRQIVATAPRYLADGGWLLVEHGWDQGAATRALFGARGYVEVATRRDHAGQERASGGRILP